jgi:ADP-sugar diphosphatase
LLRPSVACFFGSQVNGKDVPLTFANPDHEQYFDKLKEMKAFVDWSKSVDKEFVLKNITVQSIDMFGPRIGFVKFRSDVTDAQGNALPGIVFMRGGAVGMMILIVCEEDRKQYTVLTVQPRLPVGKFNFPELPAGMLDDSGDFAGVAAKELQEETGITVSTKDLVDLTEMAFGSTYQGVYPSAGGCDEFLRLFLYRTKMAKEDINKLQGKCTGVLEEGEQIKLKIISINELWCPPPSPSLTPPSPPLSPPITTACRASA